MARKKHPKGEPHVPTSPKPTTAPVPNLRMVRAMRVLSGLFLLLAIYRTFIFFTTGYSGYVNTVVFYGLFLTAAAGFIPLTRRVLRVNIIALILILFAGETYLRVSGNGFPNYTERNSASIFTPYITPNYDLQKARFIPPLWVDEPNHEFLYRVDEFSYPHKNNALGLRERELPAFKNKHTLLILGDSFTYGVGAPADSTGVQSLEKTLQAKGSDWLAYNGGSSGSDICFMYKLYEKELYKLKPQCVVLNLNKTDIFEIMQRGGDERFEGDAVRFKGGKWYQYPYSWSYIFRVVLRGVFKVGETDEQNIRELYKALDIMYRKIGDMQRLARRDGFRLAVVFTPMAYEVEAGQLNLAELKTAVQKMYPDIFVFDYLEYARQQQRITPGNIDSFYYRNDLHFKPYGYWDWGQAVADTLLRSGWLH